jgi:hypothetical protein
VCATGIERIPEIVVGYPCRLGIEIERCARCAGRLRIIASIEEPEVIAKILAHLEKTAPDQHQAELPLGALAPPVQSRLL